MPEIVPVPVAALAVGQHHVIRIAAADIGRAHALRRGVIGRTEMQAFEPLRGTGDLVDVAETQNRLDDDLETDAFLSAR